MLNVVYFKKAGISPEFTVLLVFYK